MNDAAMLTADLIRCHSVTPADGGAIELLDDLLAAAGFRTTRVDRGGIANLHARWGRTGPVLGFNGHTDVVPPGDPKLWTLDPFEGAVMNGAIYGRGAADMKSAVAAFVVAVIDCVRDTPPEGSIVLTITGDEEGPGIDGTRALLDWMGETGEHMDHCIVGEPTCPDVMGEMIKIGRRGSMTARLIARGTQGHTAYPDRARNPLSALVRLLDRLATHRLDDGTAHFDASTLAITTIDTGNPANNVIPASAHATVNIRFNDAHSGASLTQWLEEMAAQAGAEFDLEITTEVTISGESFITSPSPFTDLVSQAVADVCGRTPALSTSGGTSDARFIKDHCPVVEVGLVGRTMHQADEHVEIAHIHQLRAIYARILARYFNLPQEA